MSASPELRIKEIEARRAARAAEVEAKRLERYATDLEAIAALEDQYGANRITIIDVPFEEGLPVLVAGRAPEPLELKRYKDTIRGTKSAEGNALKATDELAAVTLIYPSADVFEELLKRRPGLTTQLGTAVGKLALGREREAGNV